MNLAIMLLSPYIAVSLARDFKFAVTLLFFLCFACVGLLHFEEIDFNDKQHFSRSRQTNSSERILACGANAYRRGRSPRVRVVCA